MPQNVYIRTHVTGFDNTHPNTHRQLTGHRKKPQEKQD